MKNTNKKLWKLMLLVVIAIIAICGLTGCTKQEPAPAPTEAPIEDSTEVPTEVSTATPTVMIIEEPTPTPEVTPAPVTVESESFSLTYSGLHAETVTCTELTGTAETDFEFTTTINQTAYTIFKVVVGVGDGDIVSMISNPDGTSTPVSFYMNTLPEGLEDDDASAFYIAQDVVNEVIDTLALH